MAGRDVIVIGASAGGVEALRAFARSLPAGLPAALFVVLHVPPRATSVLPRILSRAGRLPAVHAEDGMMIEHGTIYVAPPDHHLLLRSDRVDVVRGPKENGHRPAIDPLFRSAARAYGRRVVGVVLSGTLDDGAAGLVAVKQRGGVAIVQDPEEALFSGMPQSALEFAEIDYCAPVAQIAAAVARLAIEPLAEGDGPMTDEMGMEVDVVDMQPDAMHADDRPGVPSGFSCPECNGVLWELHDGNVLRFRCRVGHAFSANSLFTEQSGTLEAALWTALRVLEERAALSRRLVDRSEERGHMVAAARFAEQERETLRHAETIRVVLRDQTFTSAAAEYEGPDVTA